VHTPTLQASAHAAPAFCQVPVASQICGCGPLHWRAPGVQTPAHTPTLQMNGHAAPAFCHVSVTSQICGCKPSHWCAPGVLAAVRVAEPDDHLPRNRTMIGGRWKVEGGRWKKAELERQD
jgi:hypothetical protein